MTRRDVVETGALGAMAIGIGWQFGAAWSAIVIGAIVICIAVLGRMKGI